MNNIDFKNKYLKYKKKYLELKSLVKFGKLPSEAEIQDPGYFKSCDDVMEFYEKSVEHQILILSHIETIGENLGIFRKYEFRPKRTREMRDTMEKDYMYNDSKGFNLNPMELYDEFVKRCSEKGE